MTEERITRVTLEEARRMKGETDWARVDALTDEDIERAVADDPDAAPVWTEEDWARARLMVPITLHLDKKVIDWFQSQGEGHSVRIADVLRDFVETQMGKAKG